ncbi:winged helix-turn-helix transcriptional regulator, partial [Phascolarctobacterium sp.]|uniref:winged helix-turn-helix transcriptional regulator n=1 Tax=Phascolarctobacterium sp. TaxID=2049039 RepID=UPI0025FF1309
YFPIHVYDLLEFAFTIAAFPHKISNEGAALLINMLMCAVCPNKSANEGSKLTIDDSTDSEIDKQKQLLNILEKNPHITQHVMALELNTTDRTIRRMLASLQKTGIVKRKGSKKNGYWLILK